jgi:monoamine oxidase
MSTYDVIIVGAGLAGLICTRDLRKADLSVLVIEASSRVGGRCLTVCGEDLGAEWVQPNVHPELMKEFKDAGINLLSEESDDATSIPLLLQNIIAGIDADATRLTSDTLFSESIADLDNISFDAYLRARHTATNEQVNTIEALVFPFIGCRVSEISSLYIIREACQFGGFTAMINEREARVEGGMGALPHFLASQINGGRGEEGSAIQYNSLVTKVRYDEVQMNMSVSFTHKNTTTDISITNGNDDDKVRELHARVVIVAVPFNVLHRIEFEPQLSDKICEASKIGHACHPTKIWRDKNHGDENDDRSRLQQSPLSLSYTGHGVLAVTRECVIEIGEMGEVATKATAMTTTSSHNWTRDPFIGGAWLAPRPTQHTHLESLRSTMICGGQILFAGGDIASRWPGWMEGAVVSGTAVAIQAIKVCREGAASVK